MNKKKVFALALAVCLIAILSVGTLAWFSDDDQIGNEFMIAGSEDEDPDEVFSVDVWENTPEGSEDQDGYEYEDILPGDVLKKEVRVENTGAYDQYIRVVVAVSNASDWRAVLDLDANTIPELSAFVDLDASAWARIDKVYDAQNDNFWYALYAKDILKTGSQAMEVFNTVTIPEAMDRDEAAAFAGGFKIAAVAQAVQTENVGDTAYDAFVTVNVTAHAAYDQILASWNAVNP